MSTGENKSFMTQRREKQNKNLEQRDDECKHSLHQASEKLEI